MPAAQPQTPPERPAGVKCFCIFIIVGCLTLSACGRIKPILSGGSEGEVDYGAGVEFLIPGVDCNRAVANCR